MTNAALSDIRSRLGTALEDPKQLLSQFDASAEVGHGTGSGRPKGKNDVFKRAAVALTAAAWEAFVEDLCRHLTAEAFTADDPAALPEGLKVAVTERLDLVGKKGGVKPLEPWALAGHGWRTLAESAIEDAIDALHTPNSENIATLFKRLTSDDLTEKWSWRYHPDVQKNRDELDGYLNTRHKIVHGASDVPAIPKTTVWKFITWVESAADSSIEAS